MLTVTIFSELFEVLCSLSFVHLSSLNLNNSDFVKLHYSLMIILDPYLGYKQEKEHRTFLLKAYISFLLIVDWNQKLFLIFYFYYLFIYNFYSCNEKNVFSTSFFLNKWTKERVYLNLFHSRKTSIHLERYMLVHNCLNYMKVYIIICYKCYVIVKQPLANGVGGLYIFL